MDGWMIVLLSCLSVHRLTENSNGFQILRMRQETCNVYIYYLEGCVCACVEGYFCHPNCLDRTDSFACHFYILLLLSVRKRKHDYKSGNKSSVD